MEDMTTYIQNLKHAETTSEIPEHACMKSHICIRALGTHHFLVKVLLCFDYIRFLSMYHGLVSY